MEINEGTYELIERYLNGDLSGQELIDFEKQIESIPQLKEEIKINKELLAHFNEGHVVNESDPSLEKFYESKETQAFKAKLNDTLADYKKKNTTIKPVAKVRKLSWKSIALAASVLLLIGFFFIQNIGTSSSPEDLFAANFVEEPLSLMTKGSTEDNIAAIEKFYNNKDYSQAEPLLETLMDTLSTNHPNWFNLKLSQGIVALKTDKNKVAQNIFNDLRNEDSLDAPKADWYYILVLLKQGKAEEASQAIQSYLDNGGTYRSRELKEILEALN